MGNFVTERGLESLLNTPLPSLEEILSQDDVNLLREAGEISEDEHDVMTVAYEIRQIDEDWTALVKVCAKQLAEEANESINQARKLKAEILEHGGISESDYETIPTAYKRRSGRHLDDLATELGYEDGDALVMAIMGAENILNRLPVVKGKRVSHFRVMDFIQDATDVMIDEHGQVYETSDSDIPF